MKHSNDKEECFSISVIDKVNYDSFENIYSLDSVQITLIFEAKRKDDVVKKFMSTFDYILKYDRLMSKFESLNLHLRSLKNLKFSIKELVQKC